MVNTWMIDCLWMAKSSLRINNTNVNTAPHYSEVGKMPDWLVKVRRIHLCQVAGDRV